MAGIKGKKWIRIGKKDEKKEEKILMTMDDLQCDMLKKFAVKCVEGQQCVK